MEIKFRVWDKKRKKMRNVCSMSFFEAFDSKALLPKVINLWGYDCIDQKNIVLHREPKEVELMIFTGMKDMYGNPIYEGDIITINDSRNKAIVEYSEEEGCFYGYSEDTGHSYYFGRMEDKIAVIGNIYQHYNLLENI